MLTKVEVDIVHTFEQDTMVFFSLLNNIRY